MGICISSQSDEFQPTANLMLMDGSIREFVEALNCGEILKEYPGHFICSSDGIFIGRNITEVLKEDEQLQIGQLYFLLPNKKLEYLVTESDVAALLSKVSLAFKQKRSTSKKVQLLFDVHLDLKKEGQELSWAEESLYLSSKFRMGKNQRHCKLDTIVEGV